MKKQLLTFVLALLVVLTGMTIRRAVAGIGGSPVPLPDPGAIGGSPVPLPDPSAIGGSPVPLPDPSAIGGSPVHSPDRSVR